MQGIFRSAREIFKPSDSPNFYRFITLDRISDRWIAFGLLLLGIATRIIAIPASLWEWDDFLFAQSLLTYDLQAHSPHPPGFPVFVAMARAANWFFGDEYRSLTTIAFIFASLVTPALYFFYLTIFQDRSIAFAGALLGSFAPNVWLHSGAGRSDGVAFTLGIIALTLVIRGLRSRLSLVSGCAIFGLSLGVRTTLLPVMGPVTAVIFLRLLWRRQWPVVIFSLMVGTFFVLVWYIPMVYQVGWLNYRMIMNHHSQYILANDTILSYSDVPRLLYRFRRFFADLWGATWIMLTIYTLATLGLIALAVKRQWHIIGWMALSFLPYLIFTFLLNAPLGGPLYALPYVPLFSGLAACGLLMIPRLLIVSGKWKTRKNSGLFLTICLTLTIAGWAYPFIKLVHREVSPPVSALNYLKINLDPDNDLLIYDSVFFPQVRFYLPDYRTIEREKNLDPENNLILSSDDLPQIVALTGDPYLGKEGQHYYWTAREIAPRRLGRVSLERYFGAHITKISKPRNLMFLSGWDRVEIDRGNIWRWMCRESKAALLATAESMVLHFKGSIGHSPDSNGLNTIIFRLNGIEVDRVSFSGSEIDHQVFIKPNPSIMWSILSIETDQIISQKVRSTLENCNLLLKCYELEWTPVTGALPINYSPDQYLGEGWRELENNKHAYWRWISDLSIAHLPAIEGDGRLDLKMDIPNQNEKDEGEVTLEIAGKVLEKFYPPSGIFTKTYYVPRSMHRSESLDLKLTLNSTASSSDVIKIYYLGWRPSENN